MNRQLFLCAIGNVLCNFTFKVFALKENAISQVLWWAAGAIRRASDLQLRGGMYGWEDNFGPGAK